MAAHLVLRSLSLPRHFLQTSRNNIAEHFVRYFAPLKRSARTRCRACSRSWRQHQPRRRCAIRRALRHRRRFLPADHWAKILSGARLLPGRVEQSVMSRMMRGLKRAALRRRRKRGGGDRLGMNAKHRPACRYARVGDHGDTDVVISEKSSSNGRRFELSVDRGSRISTMRTL